ncbi:MAG TPA: BON domain-containing protein [Polyangiaceae bacterium]|nr:BON domain-containing protein [Polyangiaceae bacterium]
MKTSIALVLCAAGALACARSSRPPTQPSGWNAPSTTGRVETAQVSESAPLQGGIPTNTPPVAPPAPPVAPPPDQTPLTPASGVGSPRTTSAQLVPSTEASGDRADNAQDQESIREIRSALASDRTLAPIASQVTIVAKKGRVWLRGQVSTSAQRTGIERATRQAAGVFSVNNELTVME